jgi:hypothetical protein
MKAGTVLSEPSSPKPEITPVTYGITTPKTSFAACSILDASSINPPQKPAPAFQDTRIPEAELSLSKIKILAITAYKNEATLYTRVMIGSMIGKEFTTQFLYTVNNTTYDFESAVTLVTTVTKLEGKV